jgi:hypothetical protein
VRGARWAAAALTAAALASCSGGHRAVVPTTTAAPSTTTTSTTRPDDAAIALPTVQGSTTVPPIAVTPGPVTVSGTVTDTTGAPVAAATVALQRIVGNQVGQTQVTSAEDGTWTVQGILGGLYRIRAWRAPDLAEPDAAVVFLSETAPNPPVGLKVATYSGSTVQTAVTPDPPIVGEPVNIVVQVTSASVGADGVIRSPPQAGAAVAISAAGEWAIDGAAQQATSASGQVSWQATCEAVGSQALSVTIDAGDPVALTVPACAPVPVTTTTGPPANTTTTVKK